jgi:hypothetical protein
MCNKIEVGLTEMHVGESIHFLCYPCMAKFTTDILEFAQLNLTKHEDNLGHVYFTDGEESEEK